RSTGGSADEPAGPESAPKTVADALAERQETEDEASTSPALAAAEAQVAELAAWSEQNPHLLGERHRRAETLAAGLRSEALGPGGAALIARAEEVQQQAATRLRQLQSEVEAEALARERGGALQGARELYAGYLTDFGRDVPGGAAIEL